jgi:hypothetical protein
MINDLGLIIGECEFGKELITLQLECVSNYAKTNSTLIDGKNHLVKKVKYYTTLNGENRPYLDSKDTKFGFFNCKNIGINYVIMENFFEEYHNLKSHETFDTLDSLIERLRDFSRIVVRNESSDIDDWNEHIEKGLKENYIPLSYDEISEINRLAQPAEKFNQLNLF